MKFVSKHIEQTVYIMIILCSFKPVNDEISLECAYLHFINDK